MGDRLVVRRGAYFDSVTLMLASRDAESQPGVDAAFAVAATPLNRELLARRGFEVPEELGPDDLVVAVRSSSPDGEAAAVAAIEARLSARSDDAGAPADEPPRSLRSAVRRDPKLSVAFVSVPGRFAPYEIAQALDAGLHVFCFSDGVEIEYEVVLKRRAIERGLLLMGPDCGTAIVDGIGLGFANELSPGPVGLVGASGTGIQEIACLLDASGVGVSHAIGVGGRDLGERVAGAMTLHALDVLARDDATEIVVVVSKPPNAAVARSVADSARATGKPFVLAFPGARDLDLGGAPFETSLEDAARAAAGLAGGRFVDLGDPFARGPGRGFVRGLFAGGTTCLEAMSVVAATTGPVRSNIAPDATDRVGATERPRAHLFVDFGDDELTAGRAHPMIDPTLRDERFDAEASDPDVGAVVLDVVLGHGAHPDPGGVLAPRVARALRARDDLAVIASVCGSAADPQDLGRQIAVLRDAGAVVTRSSAHAGRLALAAVGARS
ncbi:MAG TPA: FdrA family protein [Actinomycetota bacterium]|nr:FdrA family protein [Actinomycetota bacterium]